MKSLVLRFVSLALVLVSLGSALRAESGNIVTAPVTFSVRLYPLGPQITTSYRVRLGTSDLWYSGNNVQTAPQVVRLEPGRPYWMQIDATGTFPYPPNSSGPATFRYEVTMSTEDGRTAVIAGMAHSASGNATGTAAPNVFVVSSDECAACGPGSEYAVQTEESSLAWRVKMGRDTDGGAVDPVSLRTSAVTSATFTRDELNFTSRSPSVTRVPASGTLRQVVLPTALLDVVDVVQSSTVVGMELRFYPIAAKGAMSGGAYAILPGYSPYLTYTFRRLNSDGSQTSFKRSGTTVEETLLTRNGSGRWNTSLAGLGMVETTGAGSNQETTVWKNADGSVARQETLNYAATVISQRELVSRIDGENRQTTWSYYGDTGLPGSKGKLNVEMSPEGDYAVYTYYNEAGPSVGQVARIYRPYASTPATFVNNHATLSQGRMTDYIWANDLNGVGTLLASRIDYVGGVMVGRTTGEHSFTTTVNGRKLLTSTMRTYSSASEYTETVTKEYAADPAVDVLYHNKPYSLRRPDLTQVSYVQQRGTWNGSSFTPGSIGDDWRTIEISGFAYQPAAPIVSTQMSTSDGVTIEPIWLVPNRSTRRVRILDNGNAVRDELHVCTSGTSFALATRTDRTFTQTGEVWTEKRVDPATAQEVVLYDSTWSNGRKTWERDAQGMRRSFTYDGKGRLYQVITHGFSSAAHGLAYSQTATHIYDGADQLVQTTLSGGLGGTLVSKTRYDLGGRVRESEAPGGFVTRYDYVPSERKLTRTFPYPGGSTTIEESYRDGRLWKRSGTAVPEQVYEYSIESGTGREKTVVKGPNATSGALITLSESWQDWAGRARVAVGQRGDDAGLGLRASRQFDSAGRLTSVVVDRTDTSARVGPAQLFGYDPALGLSEQALDVNANGTIDKASMDRIGDSDAQFVLEGSSWWLEQASGVYDKDNNSSSRDVSRQQTRLSGFSGNSLYQVRHYDALNQLTTSTTTFDFSDSARQLITTIDLPGVGNHQVVTVRNGLLATLATPQGQTFTYSYDQFRRENGRHDPRKGWTARSYVSGSNLVWREQNEEDLAAAAYTAEYTYDTSGRVSVVTDRLGRTTRYAYTARGQVEKLWGSAAMPVRYDYNARGQVWKMHTYRGGSNWNAVDWPTASTGAADTTEWVYFPNSGMLQEKRDAKWSSNTTLPEHARKVRYTYEIDGLVRTRTWARGVSTTYGYSNDLRQLTSKTYSDGTSAITGITYNRRGQLKTVTDGTGARSFHYDDLGRLQHEALPAWFGSRYVDYDYDAYGRRGSLGLFSHLDTQTMEPFGEFFRQDYVYDPVTGRLSSLDTTSPGNLNSGLRSTAYTYHAGSNEVHTMSNAWVTGGYTVTRALEARRDTVASYAMATNSGYEPIRATYARDALGRIQAASFDNTWKSADWNPLFRGHASDEHLRVGDVANPSTSPGFLYNERGELTAHQVTAKIGANWQSTDKLGMNRTSTFTYDNAQNRETGTVLSWSGVPTLDNPTPTSLNEPDALLGTGVTYDVDGNLTHDGVWAYSYDAENRLIQSAKTGLTISYTYDFMDRRVGMNSGGFNKGYIWDGWHIVADFWRSYSNALGSTFVWGIDVSGSVGGAGGVGGLVVQYYSGRAFLPLQDGQGNIRGYVDTDNGKNAVAWDFTPYGETIYARGGLSGAYWPQDFPFRYQSKMQDHNGPLIYYGLRYYHPKLGRFINRDPAGESGGLNLHAFVGNDPTNRSDVLGMVAYVANLAALRADEPGSGDWLRNQKGPAWSPGSVTLGAGVGSIDPVTGKTLLQWQNELAAKDALGTLLANGGRVAGKDSRGNLVIDFGSHEGYLAGTASLLNKSEAHQAAVVGIGFGIELGGGGRAYNMRYFAAGPDGPAEVIAYKGEDGVWVRVGVPAFVTGAGSQSLWTGAGAAALDSGGRYAGAVLETFKFWKWPQAIADFAGTQVASAIYEPGEYFNPLSKTNVDYLKWQFGTADGYGSLAGGALVGVMVPQMPKVELPTVALPTVTISPHARVVLLSAVDALSDGAILGKLPNPHTTVPPVSPPSIVQVIEPRPPAGAGGGGVGSPP